MDMTELDWGRKDKSYWKAAFAEAFKKYGRMGVVLLKAERHDHRRPRSKHRMEDPVEDYGSFWGGCVQAKLDEMTHGLYFVDRLRWADVKKQSERRRYREVKQGGCCGSEDRRIQILWRTFQIGCNYGH